MALPFPSRVVLQLVDPEEVTPLAEPLVTVTGTGVVEDLQPVITIKETIGKTYFILFITYSFFKFPKLNIQLFFDR
jgi:hypothetical protein